MRQVLLSSRQLTPGRLRFELDLRLLFREQVEREKFEQRWPEFLASDPAHCAIFKRRKDKLVYFSEELIPCKTDRRPSLLLLLGNPASHSVKSGMFFSSEGRRKEHRFWKTILGKSGLMRMELDCSQDLNSQRKRKLLELDYDSPFRLGLAVLVSIPSPASGKWSGVAGVRSLFGRRAMEKILMFEKQRIQSVCRSFLSPSGIAIAFQKDAWEGIRPERAPIYSQTACNQGRLIGIASASPRIKTFCVPPTRLAGPCGRAIKRIIAGSFDNFARLS